MRACLRFHCALLTVIGAANGVALAAPVADGAPNIVVILADDLGWSDTGAYGNDRIDTPAIDHLASEGMRLTRFYANPVCTPTRAALQSGQHAVRLGMTDFISPPAMTGPDPGDFIMGHWRPFEKVVTPKTRRALPDVHTVADALADAGYRTGYIGKWHLGFETGDLPADHGYGYSRLYERHTDAEGVRTLALMAQDVDAFLDETDSDPFFLMLAPTQPHIPLEAQEDLLQKYERRFAERHIDVPIPAYAAMVEELDDFVGVVRAKLGERDLSHSTLFVFLSDNGGLENFDLGLGGRVTSNSPLRGEKGSLYEGGLRVPFIASWPGMIPMNSRSSALGAVYDLYPTLLAAAGRRTAGEKLDGTSLLPALRGESTGERSLYFHYPHYHHDRPASTIVTRDWKLIEFLDGGAPALYELANDVGETRNVANAHPHRFASLQARLDAWQADVNAQIPVPNPDYDPDRAGEWWHPYLKEPIDVEFLRRVLGVNAR